MSEEIHHTLLSKMISTSELRRINVTAQHKKKLIYKFGCRFHCVEAYYVAQARFSAKTYEKIQNTGNVCLKCDFKVGLTTHPVRTCGKIPRFVLS